MSNGKLVVVGLGPGDEAFCAPAALQAIKDAEAVVGYKGYISLVKPEHLEGKEVYSTAMMGEVERCMRAVELAVEGKNTAVVCSGDAGIYAMAGLILELIEKNGYLDKVDFSVMPGIPAFTAAAALLGAPLMHDFASISLSDLLTPWAKIVKRLDLAAEADFVIALYNPRSKKRVEQLPTAMQIIGKHRSADTPVGIVTKAGREGQEVLYTTVGQLDPEDVGMQTVLLVGNSATRMAGKYMLTPRGYDGKYDLTRGEK
ncbi:MAG: precorrin-3B C(17)-methyltransferase [Desulfovibrio sp.]